MNFMDYTRADSPPPSYSDLKPPIPNSVSSRHLGEMVEAVTDFLEVSRYDMVTILQTGRLAACLAEKYTDAEVLGAVEARMERESENE